MLSLLLLAAAVGQPAVQPPPAPPPPAVRGEARFRSLFIDWRATGEEALAREQARLNDLAAADPAPQRQARALGDQVGEMVALGDCDGGQRLAREAGDQALLRAVEGHCSRQAGVLAVSNPDGRESR
jgi:hypothetical protein